jgi:putative transposase
MANTYTQLYVHIVFAVSGRQSLIHPSHNGELQKYITGIVTHKGHKMFAINNMPDHLHLFISMKPSESISDLVRDIKSNSSALIREKKWTKLQFSWQEGYGAFSYAKSQTKALVHDESTCALCDESAGEPSSEDVSGRVFRNVGEI